MFIPRSKQPVGYIVKPASPTTMAEQVVCEAFGGGDYPPGPRSKCRTAGNTSTLNLGLVGQHVTGTFTAVGASQTIDIGGTRTQINALEL
jgi:hypothetical protein